MRATGTRLISLRKIVTKELSFTSQERFAFQGIEAGLSKRFKFLQALPIQRGEIEAGLSLHRLSQNRRYPG